MQPDLRGISVAVLGGDARERVVVKELAVAGARVHVAGLPVECEPEGIFIQPVPEKCLNDVHALILPVPGMSEKGALYCPLAEQPIVFNEELAKKIPPGITVFVGTAGPLLLKLLSGSHLQFVEFMKLDEVAIMNSIPSAEGAVQMAMEMLPITIHGCSAVVLGFGRTGITLSRLLGAMGARTKVVARKPEHLARIFEMNLEPVPLQEMTGALEKADVIFNTIPAPVLTSEVLKVTAGGAVIIDLASAPGGTDFQAAEKLGIRAALAPGLPGKVAPVTAGRILARIITRTLLEKKLCG